MVQDKIRFSIIKIISKEIIFRECNSRIRTIMIKKSNHMYDQLIHKSLGGLQTETGATEPKKRPIES